MSEQDASCGNFDWFTKEFGDDTIGMALVSFTGQWLRVNPSFCDLLGYSEPELLASKLQALCTPEDGQDNFAHWANQLADRKLGFQTSMHFGHRTGQLVSCRLRVFQLAGFPSDGPVFVVQAAGSHTESAAHRAPKVSDARLHGVVNSTMDAIITIDRADRIALFNAAAEKTFGYRASDMMGQSLDRLIPVNFRCTHTLRVAEYAAGKPTDRQLEHIRQLNAVRANGEEFSIEVAIVRSGEGDAMLLTVILRDITERQTHAAELRHLVCGKTALLNEVHHRVRNNLQIIVSMLNMEILRSPAVETQRVLGAMQGRIRSMALLHESLHHRGTSSSVELGAYLGQVAIHAFRTPPSGQRLVRLTLDVASILIGLEQAMPCGLLVNELITNSLKHAFPGGRGGEIRLTLKLEANTADQSQNVQLCVADNGVGLSNAFDPNQRTALGLQLADAFAHQLESTLEIEVAATGGVLACVHFKLETRKAAPPAA